MNYNAVVHAVVRVAQLEGSIRQIASNSAGAEDFWLNLQE